MALLNEETATLDITKWVRAKSIHIYNDLDVTPRAVCYMERVSRDSNGAVVGKEDIGVCQGSFVAGQTFELVNPADGSVIKQAAFEELYAYIYSAFRWLKLAQDAAAAAQQNP